MNSGTSELLVRQLGLREYVPVWEAMQHFTAGRGPDTPDELWWVEHPPVFTQGQAGRPEHLLDPGRIPVIKIDRGGQVTYHGPGQLVAYVLLDLPRHRMGIRQLVSALEQSIVDLLADYEVQARARADAPGVYVGERKIASLGLRVRRGRCYHGLSLNVDMDLAPYGGINPCGYPALEMTQLRDLAIDLSVAEAAAALLPHLARHLNYMPRLAADTAAAP
ncbi:MAG: lipoyl(octanoyl) transferase LipB [Proteobacteria bacterium]|nr:MAG: lipoyl(octanoyl) transferase LipB [Pseudomonadota bacterium]QKK11333.1 MAG: lipoyl(octanoyl) transferase LipB [Pseudomonadota bacterium]